MLGQVRRRVLAERIAIEDAEAVAAYNARAGESMRLRTDLGPQPYEGDIENAPVVLLVAKPCYSRIAVQLDYAFHHRGWPLSFLHPGAPDHLRSIWASRLGALIDAFGAQHVANSVASVPLTPWASNDFDERLRLRSRTRMLELAAAAANRGATLIVSCGEAQWTEAQEVAELGPERRLPARSWRATDLTVENLGAAAWHAVCRRIECHKWNWLTA